MQLNNIASVRTGLVLSRKEAKNIDDRYEYRQLNLKSVTDSGIINFDDTVLFYASEPLNKSYLTQSGDVIVKTSEPYTAVYINEDYTGLVISSHFVIIRTDRQKAIPQYIAWYINKECIKKNFRMSCTGILKQIKPTTIAETEILLPSIERQKQIVELFEISRREIQLLEQLINQKKAYYDALLNKVNRM